jgi:hypothetical protein
MTEKEKFFNMLTICTDPRSFKYDGDKKRLYIELPILPENIKNFRKNILSIFGSPEKPIEDWDADPIYHGYKFWSKYIDIDNETIKFNKYGQLTVAEENVIDTIEEKVLTKLGIDVKNDEIHIDSFQGFSKISHSKFEKNNISFGYTPNGLDYSNPDNWYLFPQHTGGLLDIFILYPTTVWNHNKELIIDITDIEMARGVNKFLSVIMPIFKDLPVNLYMPKYRQFNGAKLEKYTLEWAANNGQTILDDVYNAFGYFLKECQSSDKFVTFSNDQGSIFNYFLATNFSQYLTPEIKDKWKNIWALGIGLDDTVLNHTYFIPSGLPTDEKTIISWNLATDSEITKNRKTWGDGTSVCINPVTFTITYAEQIKGDNISLLNYYDKYIHQIQNTITAKIEANSPWDNKVVKINIDEKDVLTEDQIFMNDNLDINQGYLFNNTIGLFAMNIRDNFISRYGLGV